jgi:hypothetical protein
VPWFGLSLVRRVVPVAGDEGSTARLVAFCTNTGRCLVDEQWRYVVVGRLLALTVVAGIALAGVSTSVAGTDRFAAAARCQNGGWKTIQPEVGGLFRKPSDCVSFILAGGVVAKIPTGPHARMPCVDGYKEF